MIGSLRCCLIISVVAVMFGPAAVAVCADSTAADAASVERLDMTPPSSRRRAQQQQPAPSASSRPAVPRPVSSLERMMKRTLVGAVLAGALGLALFVTVGQRKAASAVPQGKGRLEVLASRNIAPRCGVTLLQVDEQRVLVARDASGVKQMLVVPQEFGGLLEPADQGALENGTGWDHDAVR